MFVVNFVSGKGGTGKTLVACVLAELLSSSKTSVLLIDLDVFVRGLTSLLYFKDQSMLNLKEKDAFSVSDILQYDGDRTTLKLGISRYRSFDVLPSVPRIDSILRYQDIMPDDFETAKGILEEILTNHKVQEYDVVILDSRAGFDEFIAATHMVADCSICVEEDDEVAQVTSANLIQQLDELRGSGNVYTLTNKSWKEGSVE